MEVASSRIRSFGRNSRHLAIATRWASPPDTGLYFNVLLRPNLPTVQAVHSFLRLRLEVLPGLCALGFGVLAGVGLSIHALRTALRRYRGQLVWLILGLMAGSLYAIVNGPASLAEPLPPLSTAVFQPSAFLLGVGILLALELLKKVTEQRGQKPRVLSRGEDLL